MSEQSRNSLPRRLFKGVFAALGGIAILAAVALGVFRLLVAQIPEYQTELKEFVAAELGLAVDFTVLDARLGLRGPELTLLGASIGSGREFLQAERATITLDAVALAFSRRIEFSRLTLDGVRLTIERDEQGVLRLGDFALTPGSGNLLDSIPQSVEVAIRDSELDYIDLQRAGNWQFTDLELLIESEGGDYVATASLRPPESLAERLEMRLDATIPSADDESVSWRLTGAAEAAALDEVARLIPLEAIPAVSGRGRIEATVEWADDALVAVDAAAEIEGFSPGGSDGAPFDRLHAAAGWRRSGPGAWQFELEAMDVIRNGRSWEPSASRLSLVTDAAGLRSVSLASDFLRLEDLEPFVSAFPENQLADQWETFEPVGDIRALDFALARRNDGFDYQLSTEFAGLGIEQAGATPGIEGITGSVTASEDSGTILFGTGEFAIDWPSLFAGSVAGESLSGEVVWRQGRDDVLITGVNLGIGVDGRVARSTFELRLPHDGSSPLLEIDAELAAADLIVAKNYLPEPIMPPAVVDWLEAAVNGGTARDIRLEVYGATESFPFDSGGGQFRVTADIEDAVLDYVSGWPAATGIDGRIEFLNAGFSAAGAGESLGNRTEDFTLTIPDLRRPLLTLALDTTGSLESVVAFLRSAPMIAERLGPGFERIEVQDGDGQVSARLDLPIMDREDFSLDAVLTILEGSVAVRGLRAGITEINGQILATENAVSAMDVDGVFLGGPIAASLTPAPAPGYRAALAVEGETSVAGISEAFGLVAPDLIEGQTLWRGQLMLPALDPLATGPTRFTLASNLAGIALRLPEPLAKPPGEPTNLAVDLSFTSARELEVTGNLGATRRFALSFSVEDDTIEFLNGAVRFGGDEPALPYQMGLTVRGQIETLELDEWLAIGRTTRIGQAGPLFLAADVSVVDLYGFGQHLGETSLRVTRGGDAWLIDIDSEAIAGEIEVPRGAPGRRSIIAEMERLYLNAGGDSDLADVDPTTLPGIVIEADEFGFGNRQLGSLSAVVEPDPAGLRLRSLHSETENYQTDISGSWIRQPSGSRTAIEAELRSTDVAAALAELGLDPAVAGEFASVTASVWWDSAPTAAWLDHLYGDVSLSVETGTLREVDPGAGRVVGLMSIAALPRRLALDFRDVFEEGFAFDEIGGTFRIIDGNAYTNDLKFGGPAAEIGVVGRTGLRDRDYQQQIVVTAEPGNMLPTVGGLLGGAGVGAALLIFTRLFKEPLKGIGRASYCLTGSWEEPEVETIEDDESEAAELCAQLPAEMRPELDDD